MLEPCKPCALLRGHHPAAQPPNTAVRPHQPRRRTRSMPAAVPSSAASSSAPEVVEGMSAVLRRTRAHPLRAVLLDQFGVLHDGKTPYPAAIEACRQMHAAGLALYIISNSSRRSSGTITKLAGMGFDKSWFVGAVTSGELTHTHLADRPDPWWQTLGRKCLHLTWSTRGTIDLSGLGLELVGEQHEADFILAHGTEAVAVPSPSGAAVQERSLAELEQLLRACASLPKPPPLVCANPDLVTVAGAEGLITMPGTLARTYEAMGGTVQLMGKPSPLIYEACLSALRTSPEQVLAIGDSLEHDIAGAAAAGIEGVFIGAGIHKDEVMDAAGAIRPEALHALSQQHGAVLRLAMPFLAW